MRVTEIPLAAIRPRPGNRAAAGIDQEKLAELAQSIRDQGILQPVTVRAMSDRTYELVGGERRWRAAAMAELTGVPAVVLEAGTPEFWVELAAIAENVQRESVHPLDESTAYARLVELGLSPQLIAQRVGRIPAYVHARLRLQRLIGEVREQWMRGRFATGAAELIARLPEDHQRRVAKRIDRDAASIATERMIGWWVEEETDLLEAAPFDRGDASLVPDAPSCYECPKRIGWQGSLFGGDEVAAGERCGDRSCWRSKVAAHVERARASLVEQDAHHLEASHRARAGGGAGRLGPWDWHEANDDDPADVVRPILLVDGPKAGTVVPGIPAERLNEGQLIARREAEDREGRRLDARERLFDAVARRLLDREGENAGLLRRKTDMDVLTRPSMLLAIATGLLAGGYDARLSLARVAGLNIDEADYEQKSNEVMSFVADASGDWRGPAMVLLAAAARTVRLPRHLLEEHEGRRDTLALLADELGIEVDG